MPTISTFYGIPVRMGSLHAAELEENWRRCEQRLPLSPVEPLP